MPAGRFQRPVGSLLNALALVRDAARAGLAELGPNSAAAEAGGDAGARQIAKADLDELFEVSGKLLKMNDDTVAWLDTDTREGRTIFLSRHGESEYNLTARIGGNPPLTNKGQRYAKALGSYINSLGDYTFYS